MKVVAERLRAHRLEERMLIQFVLGDQIHIAEAARIVELKLGAILHVDDDMGVRGIGRLGVIEITGLFLRAQDRPPPRHAQMRDPDVPVIQMREQIFRAPLQ